MRWSAGGGGGRGKGGSLEGGWRACSGGGWSGTTGDRETCVCSLAFASSKKSGINWCTCLMGTRRDRRISRATHQRPDLAVLREDEEDPVVERLDQEVGRDCLDEAPEMERWDGR